MEGRVEMRKCDYENTGDASEYADLQPDGEDKELVPLSFQDMYGTADIDSRFIHNVSRLHLATQLTMLRKANLLDKELDCSLCPLHSSVSDRNSTLASRLALAEKPEGGDDEAKNDAGMHDNDFDRNNVYFLSKTCY